MKKVVKRAAGSLRAARELYRKLGRIERLSLILAAVIVGLAVAVLTGLEGTASYRQVVIGDDAENGMDLQRQASRLQEAGIDWREARTSTGARALEVPESAHAKALRALDLETPRRSLDAGSEPLDRGSFLETPDRLEARLRDANRKKIEQAILWNGNIRTATIALSSSRRASILAQSRDVGDSAAVALFLRPGVPSLRRQEADGIREMVRCAFGIRLERISISDNLFNRYEVAKASDGSGLILEKEDHLRSLLKEEIQRLYGKLFEDHEFYVGLMVSLSPQSSSIEKKAVQRHNSFLLETKSTVERVAEDVPGGILSAGAPPILLRETVESIPFDSFEKTLTDVPPGELIGVSVMIHFDLDAVERVESARRESSRNNPPVPALLPGEREAVVQVFAAREEDAIRGLLSTHGSVQVSVMVHPFRKPPADPPSDATQIATLEPAPFLSLASSWALRWWRPLAILGALLIFGAVVRALARKRSAASSVEAWAASPATAGVEGSGGAAEPEWNLSRSHRPGERLGVLGGVADINSAVRERPEVAASVLRLWLAQDSDEMKEELARA